MVGEATKVPTKNACQNGKNKNIDNPLHYSNSHLLGGGKGGGRGQKGCSDGDLHGQHVEKLL